MRKLTLAITILAASAAFAEGTVQQRTKFHMGGGLGAVVNVFGGKATREGVESTVVVKGNRKSMRHGSSGEIIDLSEEKVYRLDYDRKTYTVTTFDELRKQFEDAKKRAQSDDDDDDDKPAKNDGPEYVVEFDMKSTGNKETINGFETKQEIATITVHEKGRKLEQSGGVVMTADMAIGPKIAAMSEVVDFDRRFFTKVYGGSISGADMQQMAALLSRTPELAKAMKEFAAKSATFKGTPVRTMLKFESVAGTDQPKNEEAAADEQSAASAIVGGFLNKMKNKRAEKNGTAATPGRSSLFDSTTEILSATASAENDAVTIPAGFKKR
jgi:hypothetical protein